MKDQKSFNNIKEVWIKLIEEYLDIKQTNLLIVANKNDNIQKEDEVSEMEGKELAKEYGASFFSQSDENSFDSTIGAIINKIVAQKNINNDFGTCRIVKEERLCYHTVAPYFSDRSTTKELSEKRIYINRKEDKDKFDINKKKTKKNKCAK